MYRGVSLSIYSLIIFINMYNVLYVFIELKVLKFWRINYALKKLDTHIRSIYIDMQMWVKKNLNYKRTDHCQRQFFCNVHLFRVPLSWTGSVRMKSSMTLIRDNRCIEKDIFKIAAK